MAHGITAKDSMYSVRHMPWHRLGAVLEDYPETIDEALEKSGLTWQVRSGEIAILQPATTEAPENGIYVPQLESYVVPTDGWKANVREDTGDVLGIVSEEYQVVPNRDAFEWLDELLGNEVEIETAGSLQSGRRVWVLAKIPEGVEVGGDEMARYIYCANSHDGSMAVTAAATNIRIVCANTLGAALRQGERAPERVYKFRHTGNMKAKLEEARKVMQITRDWDRAFKEMGDEMALQPITSTTLEKKVIDPLIGLTTADGTPIEMGKIARRNREDTKEIILNVFGGEGPEGDTSGNSPGTKWCAWNAIAEYADWGRRVTVKTDQVQRSFEDQRMKEQALRLVAAA